VVPVFNIPVRETTDKFDDALSLDGATIREVWNRMGEQATFERRVAILEAFLMSKLPHVRAAGKNKRRDPISVRTPWNGECRQWVGKGLCVCVSSSAASGATCGMSAKAFARVARFQAAMNAKLANPTRTWLDIAHSFGYYNQMHMIHDFEQLGRNTPTQVLALMGDVRPSALVSRENSEPSESRRVSSEPERQPAQQKTG
jgi:hypothetical protein